MTRETKGKLLIGICIITLIITTLGLILSSSNSVPMNFFLYFGSFLSFMSIYSVVNH